MLRPCGRSQSLTSPFSGSLENTVFLWPLSKNRLCQISANNSGISFPCLSSVGVLESLACVGRDSLAKIKTVLQELQWRKRKLRGGENASKCNKPVASACLDSVPVLELIKSKAKMKGGLLGPVVSPPMVPRAPSEPLQLLLAKLSTGPVFERSRSLFFFSFSQYNPYRDIIIQRCFSSEFSLISCLWFWGFCEVLWWWRNFTVCSGCPTCSKNFYSKKSLFMS